MKELLQSETFGKIFLFIFIGFLFLSVGRIMLDVFTEQPFGYRNVLLSAMSFFFILNYIKKQSDKVEISLDKENK